MEASPFSNTNPRLRCLHTIIIIAVKMSLQSPDAGRPLSSPPARVLLGLFLSLRPCFRHDLGWRGIMSASCIIDKSLDPTANYCLPKVRLTRSRALRLLRRRSCPLHLDALGLLLPRCKWSTCFTNNATPSHSRRGHCASAIIRTVGQGPAPLADVPTKPPNIHTRHQRTQAK